MSSKDQLGRRQVCRRPGRVPEHQHGCSESGFVQHSSLVVECRSDDLLHLFDGRLGYAVRLRVVWARLNVFDGPPLAEVVKLVLELRTSVAVDRDGRTVV